MPKQFGYTVSRLMPEPWLVRLLSGVMVAKMFGWVMDKMLAHM